MAMTLYGLYMVPRKQSKLSQKAYTFWMGCGLLAGTSIIGIATGRGLPRSTAAQYALMVASGIVWATGTLAYCSAVKSIGLSRSTPIKNTSAILGTFFGIILFHEFSFQRIFPTVMVILGSVAVVVSAAVLARVESIDEAEGSLERLNLLKGVLAAVWAAIAYSAYTIPMKIVYASGVTPSEFLFFMGQGCFIGMMMLTLLMKTATTNSITWRDRRMAMLSGVMWAGGSLCANMAIEKIGVAVAWPLTKNTVIAVLYGVFILKEVDTHKHRKSLSLGLILSVIGVVLLALAMR